MKIISLMENTSARSDLITSHGLSLYLETEQYNILFDFGPNNSIIRNAKTLGIDLTAVDFAVLSHGHYDHGGGLSAFLSVNHTAPVYIRNSAFRPYFSGTRSIGIDPSLREHPQIHVTGTTHRINDTAKLFSGIVERRFFAESNRVLLMQGPNGVTQPDDFSHEQCLLLQEGEYCILIAGCAHNGIVNILERAEHIAGRPMTHVISGFHLCQPSKHIHESKATVQSIAAELSKRPSQYYTCHCTGFPSYEILHRETSGQVQYLSAGDILTFPSSRHNYCNFIKCKL